MPLVTLNLHEKPPRFPKITMPRGQFELNSADLNQTPWPFRGLLYSFLIHEMVTFSLLFLPSFDRFNHVPRVTYQVLTVDVDSKGSLIYFPTLSSNDQAATGTKENKAIKVGDEPAERPTLRTRGRSYPGSQPITSDVPNATNSFQTLLQPALQNPRVIQPPITVPNIIQMADAAPLPEAEPQKVETTAAKKELAIPVPQQGPPQKQDIVLATSSDTSSIPVPDKPTAPPLTTVRKDLIVSLPVQNPSQRPTVVLLSAPAAPALPAPERPLEPTILQKNLVVSSPTAAPPVKSAIILTPQNAVPAIAPPPQIAAVETKGPDRLNLLSVSPLPAPPQPSVKVPAAEARGRVAISPEANVTAPDTLPGVKAPNLPTTNVGLGKKPDAPNRNVTPDNTDRPPASKSPSVADGTGKATDGKTPAESGTNSANSSTNTTPKNPFSGITIQGGRLEGGTGIVSGSSSSRTITLSAPPSGSAGTPKSAYGITIVSTATSGGGLPNLGVFADEPVYTVYLDMKDTKGAASPTWTLQYALVPAQANPGGLTPPFPIVKQAPELSPELVRKYVQRLVVVYAVIDPKGKLQQISVKQTPDPQLNRPVIAALSDWVFRAAEVNGTPVSVKILLGIPLALQ